MVITSDLVSIQNPWWDPTYHVATMDSHIARIAGRSFYLKRDLLDVGQWQPEDLHILRGPRQVGKTTLIKEAIADLCAAGFPREQILYLSCESFADFGALQKLLTECLVPLAQKRAFVFLDEVSFVDEWQRAILWLNNTGLLRHVSLLVTGSNARDLKESAERFPGRRGRGRDLVLNPASPLELRHLTCFKDLSDEQLVELYFRMGGFPHALRDYVECGQVLDDTYRTYQNWMIGDAARYDIATESLKSMSYRVFETFCSRVTLNSIIEHTPLRSHETGLRYLEHLEDAFLCRMHYCWDPDKNGPSFHKARKIYFVDPLLYYLAEAWKLGFGNIWERTLQLAKQADFAGRILESSVVNIAAREHGSIFYWYSTKAKKEVDLIIQTGNELRLFDAKLSKSGTLTALNKPVQMLGPVDLLSTTLGLFNPTL